ncbi:hypothetical protein RchiOBHm_Chr7g0233291 [Rosa chinensis]|uniref:Uncharacterized protein n=1 Tax=Rosa chinensis TaxID=74649 RepID=A0A2P6PG62_ROSCH|nr:hypothetical protein RchiOBHm_Chr7g0233291 [Rosa chinensis]
MGYYFSSKLVNVQLLLGVALVVLIMTSSTAPIAMAENYGPLPKPYPSSPIPPYPGHPPVFKDNSQKPEPKGK